MKLLVPIIGLTLAYVTTSALALPATVPCREYDEVHPPGDAFWRDPIELKQEVDELGMQGKGLLHTFDFEPFEIRALTGINSDALNVESTTGDPHSHKQFKVSFWARTFSGKEVIMLSIWIDGNRRCFGKHSFNQDDLRKITVSERYFPSD